MLLMMVVVLALMVGSGGGNMGMMGHEKPVQHADQKQEANPVQDDASSSAEKNSGTNSGTSGHKH